MRRDLRRSGFRTQTLVRDVEDEITTWLREGETVLSPDADMNTSATFDLPGVSVGKTGAIRQVFRTPLKLVWSITDDPFARYVVHCCARYHEIVSFSKHSFLSPHHWCLSEHLYAHKYRQGDIWPASHVPSQTQHLPSQFPCNCRFTYPTCHRPGIFFSNRYRIGPHLIRSG